MANTRSETDIVSFIALCTTTEEMRSYFEPLTQSLSREVVMTPLHVDAGLRGPNLLWGGCIGTVAKLIRDQVIRDEAILQTHTQGNNLLHTVFEREGVFTVREEKPVQGEYAHLKAFLSPGTLDKALLQVEKQEKWTPLTTAVWCGSDSELIDLLGRARRETINQSAVLVTDNVTTVLHALVQQLRSAEVVDALLSKLDKTTIAFLWPRKDSEGKTLAVRMIEAAFQPKADERIAALIPYLEKPMVKELFKTLCEHEKIQQGDGLTKFKENCPKFYRALLPVLFKDKKKEESVTPSSGEAKQEGDKETPKLGFELQTDYFAKPEPKPPSGSAPISSSSQAQPQSGVQPGFISTLINGAWNLLAPTSTGSKPKVVPHQDKIPSP